MLRILFRQETVQTLDLKTGEAVWDVAWDEQQLGPAGNPIIANGCLIVNGHDGVVCYGPKQ